MYAEIKNFITTKYTRKKLSCLKNFYPEADEKFLENWNKLHEKLHRHLECQIRFLYPNSRLHIITNEYYEDKKNVTYHKFDFADNHLIKIFMYGLLSEPAMYIDSDIILFRKFKEEELPKLNDFNLYHANKIDIQKLTQVNLDLQEKKLYNAGVVFISNPKKNLVDQLFNIKSLYFPIDSQNVTDETCISFYIEKQKLKMVENNKINVYKSLCKKDFFKNQSVHYTGFYLQQKLMYFEDFKLSPTYKKLNTS